MKVLKRKIKKRRPGGDKLKYKPIIRVLTKIKKKQGRWCDCYDGRLPYPVECQSNKSQPITHVFDSGKKTLVYDRTACIDCKRAVEFIPWKRGDWDKVKEAIINGDDLRDMDPPFRREE